jgi:extracellular elastinolytic metalloproteinase
MRRLIAIISAFLLLASINGVTAAARPDLAVVFDASRAHVYSAGGASLLNGAGAAAADVAAAFLRAQGRSAATLASLRIDAQYSSKGITHVDFHQSVGGLAIAGAYAKAALNARGDLIHVIDNLVDIRGAVDAARVGPSQALAAALAKVHPGLAEQPAIARRDGTLVTFQKTAFFRAAPTAQSVVLARESGRLEQAFLVTTWSRKGNVLNRTLVDAAGAVAATELRTAKDSYNVYTEDPDKTAQTVVAGPGSANAESPDGWLTGSQSTISIGGNNAHAYLDTDANNLPDAGGSAVTDGNFLAVSNLAVSPSTAANQAVAVQNLFFFNNVLHDTLYQHGFTEAAGNFQEDNFGNGGSGGDSVNAEAQDGSGTDNANFATPADGSSPTMQMYLWSPFGTHEVVVNATSYTGVGAAFGPAWTTTGLTALIVAVDDGVAGGTLTDACEKLPRNSLKGDLALVDRGFCTFATKEKNAQAAGAIGMIVANNAAGQPIIMGASGGGFRIPALMVSQADGASIRGVLPETGTARLKDPQPPMIDADVDSDVVYHEYGHGLTWRMIGSMDGPMSGAIGEGASDTLAMFLNGDDRIGEYSASNPDGIRSAPYGSLTKTYADMTGAEVHADGEVYGGVGWRLLQNYLTAGKSASDVLDTWVQGLGFTPAGPAMEDMRDGMLAAAADLGRTDETCLIWEAYAHFGVGVGASGTVTHRGTLSIVESFDMPGTCP